MDSAITCTSVYAAKVSGPHNGAQKSSGWTSTHPPPLYLSDQPTHPARLESCKLLIRTHVHISTHLQCNAQNIAVAV
jgi:hypothetical protein